MQHPLFAENPPKDRPRRTKKPSIRHVLETRQDPELPPPTDAYEALLEAGWNSKLRLGRRIWQKDDASAWYSEDVAHSILTKPTKGDPPQ